MNNKRIKLPLVFEPEIPLIISNDFGATSVKVHRFFIAYNSVVTLAYEPFSKTLLNIKTYIDETLGERLTPENFSSQWPKTTLGCLKRKTLLSSEEFRKLRSLCTAFDLQIQSLELTDKLIKINELKLIVFLNRTLEKRLLSIDVPLKGERLALDEPTEAHNAFVKSVLSAFDPENHDTYYKNATATLRTMGQYYRKKHIETTLIAEMNYPSNLKQVLLDFQTAVDQEFPGVFSWFEPDSWHLTIRSLVAKE